MNETDDIDFGQTIRGFVEGQRVMGRYGLKRILGRGGMGVVWLAQDEKLDREVALKFMPETVRLDAGSIDELKRETRKNLELTHANIVRIYDFVDDANSAAIAMEYVDGDTLTAWRVRQPQRVFETSHVSPWAQQACAALEYAHTEARIVHRDIKPSNLMLDQRGRLKVTDFGIARSISDSMSRMTLQPRGTSGTLAYMSPQQARGLTASPLDDVYSLGACFYELLTSKPPFHSGEIYQQIIHEPAASLAARRADLGISGEPIPPEWEQTIMACLAKDPAGRPQSIAEIWDRLNRPVSVPVSAPGSRQGHETSRAQKSKTSAALIAVLILVLLAGAGAGWWFGYEKPRQAALAAEQTKAASEENARQAAEAAAQTEAQKQQEAARLADEKQKADQAAAEQARIAAARQQLVTETLGLAQSTIDAKQWDSAEKLTDKLASLDPQNPKLSTFRKEVADGRAAQKAAEERAELVPADLPASGFFSLPELFAGSAYAAYNAYSQGDTLRRAQSALKAAGFYEGTSDGAAGSGTEKALLDYQRANASLSVSGRLDDATLAALRLTGLTEMTAPTPTPRPQPASTPRPKPVAAPRASPPSDDFFKLN